MKDIMEILKVENLTKVYGKGMSEDETLNIFKRFYKG